MSIPLLVSLTTLAYGLPVGNVELCHVTPSGSVSIEVARPAVPAHLAHGDSYPATWTVDADGDGHGDPDGATLACPAASYVLDADDCDDTDPDRFPGNPELDDLDDDDCDLWVDEDYVQEGDVVLTEVVRQARFGGPSAVADGQWFEVLNVSDRTVDLSYWYVIRTNGIVATDAFFVDPDAAPVLDPGQYAVFCKTTTYTGDVAATWPLACDYVWGDPDEDWNWSGLYHDNTFNLQRDLDRLAFFIEGGSRFGRLVDDVIWTWSPFATDNWPRDASYSMSLDPAHLDGGENDDPYAWCSTAPDDTSLNTWWTDGATHEHGTPGVANYDCP